MKTHIITAWFEDPKKPGHSSAQGGLRDALRDSAGDILSFGSFDEAMNYLQTEPLQLNIAQVCDLTTGKYQEFKHGWMPLKPQGKQQPPQPPAHNPGGGGKGGGNP